MQTLWRFSNKIRVIPACLQKIIRSTDWNEHLQSFTQLKVTRSKKLFPNKPDYSDCTFSERTSQIGLIISQDSLGSPILNKNINTREYVTVIIQKAKCIDTKLDYLMLCTVFIYFTNLKQIRILSFIKPLLKNITDWSRNYKKTRAPRS